MRPHVLLLLAIFAFVLLAMFTNVAQKTPEDEALSFLKRVSSGDLNNAMREFGDNSCHCAPKGGYVAYLQYEYGAEPNIAFLVNRQIELSGPVTTEALPNKEPYFVPWDQPQDKQVTVPLKFPARHEPYLVPLDSAFGLPITEDELKTWESDPAKDAGKALTIRLRNSLQPGVVGTVDPNNPEFKEDRQAEKTMLPEVTKYLHPKDVDGVKSATGTVVPLASEANSLPRLKSITVLVKVVRRGSFHRWAIKKLAVKNPILITPKGEVDLAKATD